MWFDDSDSVQDDKLPAHLLRRRRYWLNQIERSLDEIILELEQYRDFLKSPICEEWIEDLDWPIDHPINAEQCAFDEETYWLYCMCTGRLSEAEDHCDRVVAKSATTERHPR